MEIPQGAEGRRMERERFLILWQLRGGSFPQAAWAVPAVQLWEPAGHEAQGRLTWRVTSHQALRLKVIREAEAERG